MNEHNLYEEMPPLKEITNEVSINYSTVDILISKYMLMHQLF
jgi:hypothetical protein